MAVVLWFAWGDRVSQFPHPQVIPATPVVAPDADSKFWVKDIPVAGILPADRDYYGRFFDGQSWVLDNDSQHDQPILDTNEKLRRFTMGSLDLCIAKKEVGKYPGLGEALDKGAAMAASGVDVSTLTTPEAIEKAVADGLAPRPMTKALRDRMRRFDDAVRWKMQINGE